MEATLFIFAISFVLAPLPICIYLLVQKNHLSKRIDELERTLALKAKQTESKEEKPSVSDIPAQKIPEKAIEIEEPPTTIIFDPDPVVEKSAPIAAPSIPPTPPKPHKPKPSIGDFLRSFGLLPPKDLERKEAGIIQWWTLRVGGLLAVLTIIFSAAYISKNTSPLVRFFELIAADASVIGLGAFFWNRRRSVGSILLAVGLSMLYVSMAAGYALSPVRVFTNPIVGIGFQFATIIGIYATSVWLKERSIAFLATVFGFGSSIFSAYVGLNEGALISAIALQFIGIAFGRRWHFPALTSLSTLGVYLPVLTFCGLALIDSRSFTIPYLQSVIAFLAIAVSTLPFTCLRTNIAKSFSSRNWRLITVLNTSLCCALGYAYVKLVGGNLLWLYGTLALVLLSWAALFSRRGLNTLLFQLFFLKGSGFGALWLVNYFTGEVRWFALVIECGLIAWSTRQSKSKWSECAGFLLWLAAANMAANGLGGLTAWSLQWSLYVAFPILSVGAVAFQLRGLESNKLRNFLYTTFGLVNGLAACIVIGHSDVGDTRTAIFLVGFAIVFAALTRVPQLSKRPLLLAVAPPLIGSHLAFWNAPESIVAFLVVIGAATAFAYASAITIGSNRRKRSNLPEYALVLLTVTSIYAYCTSEYGDAFWFPYFAPIFAIALKGMRRHPFKTLSDAYILPILLDLAFYAWGQQGIATRAVELTLYVLLLATPLTLPRWERNLHFLRSKGSGRKTAHLLVAALFFASATSEPSWLASNLIALSGAGAFFVLWRLHRHRTALAVSTLFVGVTLTRIIFQYLDYGPRSPWSWHVLLIGGGLALATLAFGSILALRPSRRLKAGTVKAMVYAASIASYLSIAFSLAYPGLSLDSYYTPMIATYGLVLIGIGIGLKIKPFRMIALIGFLLPLGRLFIFDVQETLHRIIAFAALAVLLTTIGYLYNRYASRIE